MENNGEQFLHTRDGKLHTTKPVEYEQERRKGLGLDTSHKPAEKISDWLEVIDRTHSAHEDDPLVMERIKKYYHSQYVIKPLDVPKSYFDAQVRMAREQGHGDISLDAEDKAPLVENIIRNQEASLDVWVDYFSSEDSGHIPTWAKYWAFKGMLGVSTYNKEKKAFGKRDKSTVAPFAELNREALAFCIKALKSKVNNEALSDHDDVELDRLLEGANFGKLYSYALDKVRSTELRDMKYTEGEWIKYKRGSDPSVLTSSLQGHGTGWCTAEDDTAQFQLGLGDFYVYYTYDDKGEPTIPRAAIRMEGGSIGEVRGIEASQNLDSFIIPVVDSKMGEFGLEGEKYQKRISDMGRLTQLENNRNENIPLGVDDLRFLYEVDDLIEGFGYESDPRIYELLRGRDCRADLSKLLSIPQEQISLTLEEALSGNIKYHYGSLSITREILTKVKNLTGKISLPEQVARGLYMADIQKIGVLTLPKIVGGDIQIKHLRVAKEIKMPERIGGSINMPHLQSVETLIIPDGAEGSITLPELRSVGRLVFPDNFSGNIILPRVESGVGITFPKIIRGSLDLKALKRTEGLELPQTVNGDLILDSLDSSDGLRLPVNLRGGLSLKSLKSGAGLVIPESMAGTLDLRGVVDAHSIHFPVIFPGDIYLPGLANASNLELPEVVEGNLTLGCRTAKSLRLPRRVGGGLRLEGLTSDEGLVLPEEIEGWLWLNNLTNATTLKFPETVNGGIHLDRLASGENVTFPKHVEGSLILSRINARNGFKLPDYIGGNLEIPNVESLRRIIMPRVIKGQVDLYNLPQEEQDKFQETHPGIQLVDYGPVIDEEFVFDDFDDV